MKIQVLNSYIAANATFYANVQNLAAAGPMVLNYATQNADANIVVSTPQWNRQVTFTSIPNNELTHVTILGTDVFGNIVTEVLAGSNNNTVTSTKYYSTLISLTADGPISAMSVGFGILAQSIPFKMSMNVVEAKWAVQTVTTGVINYTLQYTLFPFENYTSPPTFDNTNNWLSTTIAAPGGDGSVGLTVDIASAMNDSEYFNFAAPVYAIRFVINSGTTPTFEAFIAQQGTL